MSWNPPNVLACVTVGMASWLERQSAVQIEFFKAENRSLRAWLGKRRLLFTEAGRLTLATLAKAIGSRVLADLNPSESPVTLLRWHRELLESASKWMPLSDSARTSTSGIDSQGELQRRYP